MKPKSGKYNIKLKIHSIDKSFYANVIGIISQDSKNYHKTTNNTYINTLSNVSNVKSNVNDGNNINIYNHNIDTNHYWCYDYYDYIGWSATDGEDDKYLPNGLLCGFDDNSRSNNIFRGNKFVYQSNNKNYEKRLPGLKTGDTVMLQYDSHLSTLTFSKEDSKPKLNSCIKHLPPDVTFYWFVGHWKGQIHVKIVTD